MEGEALKHFAVELGDESLDAVDRSEAGASLRLVFLQPCDESIDKIKWVDLEVVDAALKL